MSKLPTDCLNEIFEYLEDDEITLRSCLLANRLCCKVSVRILWRSIRNYDTLITCLSSESKELLYQNRIITPASAVSNPPTFNYSSFCKVLSVYQVKEGIFRFLILNKQFTLSQEFNDKLYLVTQEILKLLMKQISSLRKLEFYQPLSIPNFTSFLGAKDCLKDLTELCCNSNIYPEFYYQLSQACRNIKSLDITLVKVVSNGLAELISVQQNLKCLRISQYYNCKRDGITPLLMNLPNTLIKLNLYGKQHHSIPLSFIAKLSCLQEIILLFEYQDAFEDFKELQYVTFSQLRVLKLMLDCPKKELLVKFLENNGKNLKELFINYGEHSLNLAIAKFCPNLRKLYTELKKDELETLVMFFNSCQYLESISILCGGDYLNDKDLFEVVAKNSSENFYELKLYYSYGTQSELLPEKLESFFISWVNRIPLSFMILCNDSNTLDENGDNMKIIEKYVKLGIIKKFKIFDKEFFVQENDLQPEQPSKLEIDQLLIFS